MILHLMYAMGPIYYLKMTEQAYKNCRIKLPSRRPKMLLVLLCSVQVCIDNMNSQARPLNQSSHEVNLLYLKLHPSSARGCWLTRTRSSLPDLRSPPAALASIQCCDPRQGFACEQRSRIAVTNLSHHSIHTARSKTRSFISA